MTPLNTMPCYSPSHLHQVFWLRQFEMGITAQSSMVRLWRAQATWDWDWGAGPPGWGGPLLGGHSLMGSGPVRTARQPLGTTK